MIFGPSLEPDHHYEEYINYSGDDADFIQTCINSEQWEPCTSCGQCEHMYFACSEDEAMGESL